MRFRLFTLILLLATCYSQAGVPESGIDSLRTYLKHPENDSLRVLALNRLAYELVTRSEFDEVPALVEEARAVSAKINDCYSLSFAVSNLGTYYYMQGKYAKAIDTYQESRRIALNAHSADQVAGAAVNIGNILNQLGDYESALTWYTSALKEYERMNRVDLESNLINNMAYLFYSSNDLKTGKSYIEKGFKLASHLKDETQLVGLYTLDGMFKQADGQLKDAETAYQKALQLAVKLNMQLEQCDLLLNLGDVMKATGKADSAEVYYKQAIAKSAGNGQEAVSSSYYKALGALYLEQGRYKESVSLLQKALSIARELESISEQMDVQEILAKAYEKSNQPALALQALKAYGQLRDSILGEEKQEAIQRLEIKYQSEKKDQNIVHLKQENSLREKEARQATLIRNLSIAASLITLLLVAIATWFYIRQTRLKRELAARDLRDRISRDLHDEIGSTLSSISFFSEYIREKTEGQPEVSLFADRIAQSARDTMENMSDIVWAVNPSNDRLEDILKRMEQFATRITESGHVQLTFSAQISDQQRRLNMHQRRNLYLIFKEAVNNAMKYAGAQHLTVTLKDDQQAVVLEVIDDGKGFEMDAKKDGNGLHNMKKRAAEASGTITLKSAPGAGTAIRLELPLS